MNLRNTSFFLEKNALKKLKYNLYEVEDGIEQKDIGVICAHNLLFNNTTFTELAQSLSQIINIAYLDLPGHGNSDHLDSYNIDYFLNSCISVINSCGFKRIIWIGHGLGGLIGIKLASTQDSPIISLILDEVSPNSLYEKLRSPIMQIRNYKTIVDLAEKIQSDLSESIILKDRMKFVIRNFDLQNGVFNPFYDPKLIQLNEQLDFYHIFCKLPQSILLLSKKESLFEDPKNSLMRKNVVVENVGGNPICRYGNIEKERITCWIKNILKVQENKSRLEVGVG